MDSITVQSEGRSMRRLPQRRRRLAAGAATDGARGLPVSPFCPGPSAPMEGEPHDGDPTAAKPGCRVDQRAMHAAFRGHSTGCCRVRVAVSVGWRSVPDLCPVGVANRQANSYCDTPAFWLATQHTRARYNPCVPTFGAAGMHLGAPVGLTFPGCAGCLLPGCRHRGSQHGQVVLQ